MIALRGAARAAAARAAAFASLLDVGAAPRPRLSPDRCRFCGRFVRRGVTACPDCGRDLDPPEFSALTLRSSSTCQTVRRRSNQTKENIR